VSCHALYVRQEGTLSGFMLCSLSLGSESLKALDSLMQRSPSDELHFTVPRDPYLSPYWASDEVLKQFPPTKIVVSVKCDVCIC